MKSQKNKLLLPTKLISIFLSDPGPIIVYPGQQLSHWLSHDLVEDLMNWPKCADYADYVDYAYYAECAKYANKQNMQNMQNKQNM